MLTLDIAGIAKDVLGDQGTQTLGYSLLGVPATTQRATSYQEEEEEKSPVFIL